MKHLITLRTHIQQLRQLFIKNTQSAQSDKTPTVIASTASPYKFPRVAVEAVSGQAPADDFIAVKELEKLSGVAIPKAVNGLETAEVRHKTVVATGDMQKAVENYLGL